MIGTKIGQHIIHLETIESTNNYAATMFKSGKIKHGAVIMADIQTKGKGQRGKVWQSEPYQNLTCSILFEHLNTSDFSSFSLNHLITLSIIDYLNDLHIPATIKWPNDIYIKDQKLAGILIENQQVGNRKLCSIVGIGINVNQTNFVDLNAISLCLIKGKNQQLKEVLFTLIGKINNRLSANHSEELLLEEFNTNLWRKNNMVSFIHQENLVEGKILRCNEYGEIEIQSDGETQRYRNGEITFVIGSQT